MHARVTRIRGDAARMEAGARWFQEELLPQLETMDGYSDGMLMIDRDHGECLAVTFWETPEALRASEARAEEMRTAGANQLEGAIAMVERFEVAVQASSLHAAH